MKKHSLFSIVVSSLFSSLVFTAPDTPVTIVVTAAPPHFPSAGQAFKKIYSNDLSVADAQTQPWFESYEVLYKQLVPLKNPNSAILKPKEITALLTNLQKKTTTPDAAHVQFQTAQTALKLYADSVFSA